MFLDSATGFKKKIKYLIPQLVPQSTVLFVRFVKGRDVIEEPTVDPTVVIFALREEPSRLDLDVC